MVCPTCKRPVATTRPQCLYCGAALPRDIVPAETPAVTAPPREGEGRALVILDLDGGDAARLAAALDLAPFEAAQRRRRGGLDLWRSLPAAEAEAEAARLRAGRIPAAAIPESGVRQACRPRVATGGRVDGGALLARTAEGALRIGGAGVLLLVQGEITREYAPTTEARRARTASLEPGCRIHVHLGDSLVPLEIDPGSFDFGSVGGGHSSLLTLVEWLREVAPQAPVDHGFRRQAPALGPAEADLAGPVAAARALSSRRGRGEAPSILDNLAQFRFYSAWRGAAERRRPFGGPS
jgi:hypothetical protein